MRRVFSGIAWFVAICGAGGVGYMIAGWPASDAFYMVFITIFGVGYGEVRPVTSPELRAFTVTLIVGGYGAAIYAVGGFVQLITEGEVNRALGARRMTKGISSLKAHTIICGFGRIGRILAAELERAGASFVVVDRDTAKIVEAEARGHLVVTGDAAREDILAAAGIDRATVLAAVLPSDAANVFVTLTATGMNRSIEVIARAEDPASESKLRRSGATMVIMPAAIGAERIANLVTRPSAAELLRQGEHRSDLRDELSHLGLAMEEFQVVPGSSLAGQTVDSIEVHGNRGFLLLGVRNAAGRVVVNPAGEERLVEGDTVIVLGHTSDLPQLRKRYALARGNTYRDGRLR